MGEEVTPVRDNITDASGIGHAYGGSLTCNDTTLTGVDPVTGRAAIEGMTSGVGHEGDSAHRSPGEQHITVSFTH